MTATFGGDSDAVVAEGHKLQQLASDLDALVPFLRDVSTEVVDDIAGAATSAQQTGDALSAVTAEDPADVDLVNLARESIHQVEDRWIERVRDAGVTCAGQKV